MRTIWVTPTYDYDSPEEGSLIHDANKIVLATASRRVEGAEMSEGGYIQGAGDDSEGWARGLTAPIWWSNSDLLLNMPEAELPELITGLLEKTTSTTTGLEATLVQPTRNVWIGSCDSVNKDSFDLVIQCLENPPSDTESKSHLMLRCGQGKLGSRDLRKSLPNVRDFLSSHLSEENGKPILFTCPTGKDLSVGVALAALCLFFDDTGKCIGPQNQGQEQAIDKPFIRKRLAWIIASKPDANPSRTTLQAVNGFLMERP